MNDHNPSHAGSGKIRRRANKACLACRARKVRCDVSQRGRPCMNCFLDGEACVVIGRASRRRASSNNKSAEDAVHKDPPAQGEQHPGGPVSAPAQPLNADVVVDMLSDHGSPESDSGRNSLPGITAGGALDPGREPRVRGSEDDPHRVPSARHAPRQEPLQEPLHQVPNSSTRARVQQLEWMGEQSMRFGSDVTYSYYPFLEVTNLPNILPQDVSYLEMQGCLRVPTKPTLDDFIKQYYLHVYPIMPLVNEGAFWEMYGSQPGAASPKERLSLLVLQAMLFAACSYVPQKSLETLGFVDIKSAKEALYRRTKLLFDFGAESSPIDIAQTALLLSAWSPLATSECAHSSSYWLSVAIQQAQKAGAHRNKHITDLNVPRYRRISLRTLWPSIILQDRLLSLCSRRPIQLSRAHCGTEDEWYAACKSGAMWDEAKRGRVYNASTKASLNEVYFLMVNLALTLTNLLTELMPLDDKPFWETRLDEQVFERIEACEVRMRVWHEMAIGTQPELRNHQMLVAPLSGHNTKQNEFQHESVTLYGSYMYLLYHSALTKLYHHQSLCLLRDFHSKGEEEMTLRERTLLANSCREMHQAASAAAECLKVLVTHRLSRWAPVNSIPCISLPLVLCIIKAKLLPPSTVEYHRLRSLSEATKKYQPQPDVEDHLYEAIQGILDAASLDDEPVLAALSSVIREGPGAGADYNDTISELSLHPAICLRVALLSSTSRFTGGKEDLASLRRLFTVSNLTRTPCIMRHGALGCLESSAELSRRRRSSVLKSQEEALRQTVARWTQEDQAVSFGVQLGIVSAQAGAEDAVSDGGSESESVRNILAQVLSEAADTLEGNLLSACVFGYPKARAERRL